MRVLLGAQDIIDLVNDIDTLIVEDATQAQRNVQRDTRKKDPKALFYIHECVDTMVFEKIADCDDKLGKKSNLKSIRKQYKNLNIKNNENVPD